MVHQEFIISQCLRTVFISLGFYVAFNTVQLISQCQVDRNGTLLSTSGQINVFIIRGSSPAIIICNFGVRDIYRRTPFIRTLPERFTQFRYAGGSDRRKIVAGRPVIGQ